MTRSGESGAVWGVSLHSPSLPAPAEKTGRSLSRGGARGTASHPVTLRLPALRRYSSSRGSPPEDRPAETERVTDR